MKKVKPAVYPPRPLHPSETEAIRQRLQKGEKSNDIAADFKCSTKQVAGILARFKF